MAEPRPSTDEESAPLLSSNGHAEEGESGGFLAGLAAATHEPLSLLSKVLLGICLLLLLLTSVFVGLFAGAEHRIRTTPPRTVTTTVYATTTATRTATYIPPQPTHTEPPTCLTPECISLAASLLSSLDTTVDPCDDFYTYANGGWLAANPLPAAKASFGQFNQLAQKNVQVIRDIITRDIASDTSPADIASLTKLKNMYKSCMDEDRLYELDQEPLLNVTRTVRKLVAGHIMDGLSTSASSSSQSVMSRDPRTNALSRVGLTAAVAYLHSRGVPVLFSFYVDGDAGVDPDFMTLQFSQDGLGLPAKEYYEETSVVDAYTKALYKVLLAVDESPDSAAIADKSTSAADHAKFWPPISWPPWGDGGDDGPKENKTARATRLSKAVADFEIKLAKAHLDLDILYQDPFFTYNPYSFENLTKSLPEIDFPNYVAAFTPRAFPEKVIVSYPGYLPALSKLITETDADVMEAYFVTRVSFSLAPYLSTNTEVWKAKRELDELLRGLKKGAMDDREEWCLQRVESTLGFAGGRFFVEEVFGGDSQAKATKVITDIIDTFKKGLPDLGWMDHKSAKAAAEKATELRVKVGFPSYPNTTNDRSILSWYRLVKPDPAFFFDNVLQSIVSENFRMWSTVGKVRNPGEWMMFPSTVNAYYNPTGNEIVFPAGILRPPFFSKDWPTYLSYASFGGVAAHELTHAFDSAGRMYNQRGKLEEWWTNSTSDAFNERAQCIKDQYFGYTVDDGKGGVVHVNGNLTSGENIGDAGLIYAYHAWKAQEAASLMDGSEYNLPGFQDYTREQLFFIAYGRIWARNMKIAAAVQQVRTDPHSPAKYRVMGTLSNIPEFAKAFNCPKKSPMNPKKRCKLWA